MFCHVCLTKGLKNEDAMQVLEDLYCTPGTELLVTRSGVRATQSCLVT